MWWGSTKKIFKKTREAKRWPARRTTVGVKKKEIGGGVCGSMRSTKICGVLKKNIIVDGFFFIVVLLLVVVL